MEIIISASLDMPIYEQIVVQIKNQIISKEIKSNEALPSIRKLAKELHVSVITTQKAYEILLRDGFIITLPGKGTYVSEMNQDFIIEESKRRIERILIDVSILAKQSSISLKDLYKMLEVLYEEDNDD